MLKRWIKNKTIREWVEAIFFALLAAFIIRTWFYAPFRVPTGSMIPTIYVGDQIIADMNKYGFTVPFSSKKIWSDPINRGDIVIFPSPENPAKCSSTLYSAWDTFLALAIGFVYSSYVPDCVDYIKRVVAIGGDKIEMIGEKFFVNDVLESGYKPYFNEDLAPRNIYYKDTIPAEHIFVMGDNRRDSYDARFWHIDRQNFSYIANEKIRAKGKLIYFSIDPNKSLLTGGVRWDRIFSTLK